MISYKTPEEFKKRFLKTYLNQGIQHHSNWHERVSLDDGKGLESPEKDSNKIMIENTQRDDKGLSDKVRRLYENVSK